jgi:hypothetical protein
MKKLMEHYIIVEGYKEALSFWTSPPHSLPSESVAYNIERFKTLVNKNQITGIERNIDYWRKLPYGYSKWVGLMNDASSQPTRTQLKRKLVPGESIKLVDTPEWLIVIPLDTNASNFYGKGTKWCTTVLDNNHFMAYFNNGTTLIYCINVPTNKKWVVTFNTKNQHTFFLNSEDDNITQSQFIEQTGLDVQMVLDKMHTVSSTVDEHRTATP